MREFALTPSDLGLLTSTYFMAFGLASCRSACFSIATARGGWSRRSSASPRSARSCSAPRAASAPSRRPRADRARRVGLPHGRDKGVHALVPALAPRDHQRLVHLHRQHRRPRRDRAGGGRARDDRLARDVLWPRRGVARGRRADRPVGAGEGAARRGCDLGAPGSRHRPDPPAAALLAHRAAVRDHSRRLPGVPGAVARPLAHRRRRAPARGCGAAAARVCDGLRDRLGGLRQLRRPARRARLLPPRALQVGTRCFARRVPRIALDPHSRAARSSRLTASP